MNYRSQLLCLALLALAGKAVAAPRQLPQIPEGETLYPYVYGGVTYDDNVFRVADQQEAQAQIGTTQMDDTITHYGAGLRIKEPISLQTIRLDAAIEQVNYHEFDNLDHAAGNGLLAWDWEIGRLFDGTLSHSYTRDMSDFTEFRQPIKDMRTSNVTHFDGGYHILPAWRIVLGGENRDIDYEEQNFLDRQEVMGFSELQYATTADSYVGLRAQHTNADLEQTMSSGGMAIDNDYKENEYSLVVGWQGTSKSYLEGRAGYTRRDPDGNTQSDFSGVTARLLHLWQITPITSLETSIYRETNALDYQISSFVISNGVSLKPALQITPATRLYARLAYRQDDFKGEVRDSSGTIISDRGREDDVALARLAMDYGVFTDLNLLLGVEYGNRDSNRSNADYDYTQVLAEVSYGF